MSVVHGVRLRGAQDRVAIGDRERPGGFEPESMQAWRRAIVSGQVAIDVGSYTGLYAIVAAKMDAVSIAWEANPDIIPRLERNIAANGVVVHVEHAAASDRDGEAKFYIPRDMTSAGRLKARKGWRQVTVRTSVIAERRKVCAMKLDIEGAELPALRGAREILLRDRPVVIAEALTPADRDELVAMMESLGYRWREADVRNLVFSAC